MKLYQKIKLFITVVLIGYTMVGYAQYTADATSFDGIWAGKLKNDDDQEQYLILKISQNNVKRYMYNEDKDDFELSNYERESTMLAGNNIAYTWINLGGVWSETQTHLLSFLKPGVLWCRLLRQVTNAEEDKDNPGINNEWSTFYQGRLDRYNTLQEFLDSENE